jgi:hypothetical protein
MAQGTPSSAPPPSDVRLATEDIRSALRLGEVCGAFPFAVSASDVEGWILATRDQAPRWRPAVRFRCGHVRAFDPTRGRDGDARSA